MIITETFESLAKDFPWGSLQYFTATMPIEIAGIRLLLIPCKDKYAGNIVVRLSPEVRPTNAKSLIALAAVTIAGEKNSDFKIIKGIDKQSKEPLLYLNKKANNE